MFLTPRRIENQIKKADKLMRILWRLYSPYRSHRKKIVKASYLAIEIVEILEDLLEEVKQDYKKEIDKPLTKTSIPPGYLDVRKETDNDS